MHISLTLIYECVQVEYIPQAKIASLFVVFGLVIVCKYICMACW